MPNLVAGLIVHLLAAATALEAAVSADGKHYITLPGHLCLPGDDILSWADCDVAGKLFTTYINDSPLCTACSNAEMCPADAYFCAATTTFPAFPAYCFVKFKWHEAVLFKSPTQADLDMTPAERESFAENWLLQTDPAGIPANTQALCKYAPKPPPPASPPPMAPYPAGEMGLGGLQCGGGTSADDTIITSIEQCLWVSIQLGLVPADA